MKKSFNLVLASIAVLSMAFFSFKVMDQNPDWKVPADAAKMENPVPNDDEAMSVGKALWDKHCKSCHGKEGLGDGTKAEELDTYPGDFTSAEFQNQTDGALFYKLTEGKDDMPGFTKKISYEEDRWMLVHYMRTLK